MRSSKMIMLIAVTDDGKYTFVSICSATQSSALTRENLPNRTQHAFSPYRTNVYLKCNSPQYPRPGMSGAFACPAVLMRKAAS